MRTGERAYVETYSPQYCLWRGRDEPRARGVGVRNPLQDDLARPAPTPGRGRPGKAGGARDREVDEDRKLSFEQIHEKYHAKIYNLILRMVNDREDAEDLTVETFVNAWRAWDRFRGEARVSTWLHQIALNNCKNRFKQRDRQREHEPVSLDEAIETEGGELGREVADWRDAPERVLMNNELSAQIERAVDALAPEYKSVLVLCEIEGMSYEEIAQVLGLSVPAVKTRLHRARMMVRRRLEPYYRGWSGRA